MLRATLLLVLVLAVAACAWGQAEIPRDQSSPPPVQAPPRSEPVTHGPGDSSSRDSESPPGPPPADVADDSVTEVRPWDPHKAMKDVEIGNFYFKQDNYRGALSRYCEALQYKPGDAAATFRVAEALEKLADFGGALGYYEQYLKILPNGPAGAQAKKAIERIKGRPVHPDKHLAQKEGCEAPGKVARTRPEPFDPDRPVLTRNPASSSSGRPQ